MPSTPASTPGKPGRQLVKPVADGFPKRSSLDASIHFVLQHFLVRSAADLRVAPGVGILAVSAYRHGTSPLVLLADLQSLNSGASLTNAASAAVAFVAATALKDALGVEPSTASWVELDSEGCFDLIEPLWPISSPLRQQLPALPHINWAPLRHNDRVRTLDAMLRKFPEIGPSVWHETQAALRALTPPSPALRSRQPGA